MNTRSGDLAEGQLYLVSFFARMLAALAINTVRGLLERQRYFSPEACDLVLAFREFGRGYERGEPMQREDWIALQGRMEAALAATLGRGGLGGLSNCFIQKLGSAAFSAMVGEDTESAAATAREIVSQGYARPTIEELDRERKFLGALITLSAANKQRCMT